MLNLAWIFAAGLLAVPGGAAEDRDVISVNGAVIRQSEVMDRLWKRYGPATLNEMVDELLLRQAAQAQGLKADETEVDKQFNRVKEQFSDPAIFESQLKQAGRSVAALRADIAEQVLIRKLILKELKISIKEEELKKAFAEQRGKLAAPPAVRLRHILVKTEPEADEIVAKVRGGADFGALAREKSLAPTGKLNGGDYGFVSRGMLPEEIEKIAFDMKAGEVRVVSSTKGFHILQVTDKRSAAPAKYEDVKEDLRDMVLEDKMKKVVPGYLEELRRKAELKPLGSLF